MMGNTDEVKSQNENGKEKSKRNKFGAMHLEVVNDKT